MSSLLFLLASTIFISLVLFGIAVLLQRASKNHIQPGVILLLFIMGLSISMWLPYYLIGIGISRFALGNDEVFGAVLGVTGNITDNIWFTLGTLKVNYTIFSAGVKLISISGVLLGAVSAIFGYLKK